MNTLSGSTRLHLHCLAVALAAAVEAGKYFQSRIDSIAEIKTKSSPSDLVTDVDPACEQMIRARITAAFAEHTVLGEESTAPGAQASAEAAAAVVQAPHLWIVDPLDGTTNFVHGMPLSVVSIAYAENGQVQVGVIYDPYRDEMFCGVHGLGAYITNGETAQQWAESAAETLPGRPMQASRLTELRRCVVATGIPTRSDTYERTTSNTVALLRRIKSIRALGAAALHLAYIASGRIDGFFEYDLNAWDIAAGALLVEQAGGVVAELGGGPYQLKVRDILACGTAEVADQMNAILTVPHSTAGVMTNECTESNGTCADAD